jgi:hypothetical protein
VNPVKEGMRPEVSSATVASLTRKVGEFLKSGIRVMANNREPSRKSSRKNNNISITKAIKSALISIPVFSGVLIVWSCTI